MSYRFCLFVILFLLTMGSASAGLPLLTDDPDTPGDKHWKINVACILNKYQTESTYEAPNLDLNYGVGDNIHIKYEVPWLILHEQGIGTQTGLGNSNFGVKWRFLDEEQYGVNMSTYPQYEFNSLTSRLAATCRDPELGDGLKDIGAPQWMRFLPRLPVGQGCDRWISCSRDYSVRS